MLEDLSARVERLLSDYKTQSDGTRPEAAAAVDRNPAVGNADPQGMMELLVTHPLFPCYFQDSKPLIRDSSQPRLSYRAVLVHHRSDAPGDPAASEKLAGRDLFPAVGGVGDPRFLVDRVFYGYESILVFNSTRGASTLKCFSPRQAV